jgi:hypothetical protein
MTRGGTAARVISVECRIFPCQKCIIAPTTISIREKDGKREREREREREGRDRSVQFRRARDDKVSEEDERREISRTAESGGRDGGEIE